MVSTGSEDKRDRTPPPTLISDSFCNACNTKVDLDLFGISCYSCKQWFHASGCSSSDLNNVSCPTYFKNLSDAVKKTGGFAKRFGRFLFVCDFCSTENETSSTVSVNDRVTVLGNKLSSFESDIKNQLDDMKDLIREGICSNKSTPSVTTFAQPPQLDNVWDDIQRVDRIRHVVVIKDNNDKPVSSDELEKSCVESGVSVTKSFPLSKSQGTGVVVIGKSEADKLRATLNERHPGHETETLSAKTPRVSVVGLQKQYSKDELTDMIVRQNPGINAIFNGQTTSSEDRLLNVVAVVPLRNNPNEFKAVIRVSNLVRSVISKQQDKLYVGMQSRCKVYDNFFVLRCYNCQEFGHHSEKCKSDPACAHCGGSHKTSSCDKKADATASSCVNCAKQKLSDKRHSANDPNCPILLEAQKKLKQSVPFYRGMLSANS